MIDGPRVPPASGAPPRSLVILLHGYGSNGADLISLAPYWRGVLPGAAFVAPNAPEPCPGAPDGYQWWSITSFDPSPPPFTGEGDRAAVEGAPRAAGAARAAPILEAFIDAELARQGLDDSRLALVGFSQGTMMALQVGPARPWALAGIVGYSGMLADEAALAATVSRPPVLLIHGDSDPMIPLSNFSEAKAALTREGFSVESHVSHGLGHSIDGVGLQLGARFLERVLG